MSHPIKSDDLIIYTGFWGDICFWSSVVYLSCQIQIKCFWLNKVQLGWFLDMKTWQKLVSYAKLACRAILCKTAFPIDWDHAQISRINHFWEKVKELTLGHGKDICTLKVSIFLSLTWLLQSKSTLPKLKKDILL